MIKEIHFFLQIRIINRPENLVDIHNTKLLNTCKEKQIFAHGGALKGFFQTTTKK